MSDKTFNEIVVGRKILGIEISDSKGSDSIAAYNSGSYIGELILDTEFFEIEQKLQAAEEKLTECAANYWKEVEKRKAAEERIRDLESNCFIYSRDYKRGDNKKIFSRTCIQKGIARYEQKLQAAEEENKRLEKQNYEIQNKFLKAVEVIAFYQDPLNWYAHNQVKYSDICDSDIRHDNRLCQRGGLRAEKFMKTLEKVKRGEE